MGSKGFTLIEMLLAIFITSLLFGGLIQIYTAGYTNFFEMSLTENLLREQRQVIQSLDSDLKEYGSKITLLEPTKLEITKKDGSIVKYELNGSRLEKTMGGNSVVLTDHLESWSFEGNAKQVRYFGNLKNRLSSISIDRTVYIRTGLWDFSQ